MTSRINRTQSLQPTHIASNKAIRDSRISNHRIVPYSDIIEETDSEISSPVSSQSSPNKTRNQTAEATAASEINPPSTELIKILRSDSARSNSPMTSHYSNVKRYPTVIEEVFVLRDENEEVNESVNGQYMSLFVYMCMFSSHNNRLSW